MQQDPILQGEDGLERSSEKESTKDKRQSRINALVFGLVFLLVAIAPYPWNSYAPLLFLLPLIYSILNKLKQKSGEPGEQYPPPALLSEAKRSQRPPEIQTHQLICD
jgi:hypothetical protein